MPTLFLHAPHSKTRPGTHHKDFYTILASGIGPDYAIYPQLIGQINPGMSVVVFDRDRKLMAEGKLIAYNIKSKAGNGVQRYDVRIQRLTQVAYANPPAMNHCGVEIY